MRNDKRVEIISFLQKNTNSENTKNIDEIIADIYAADNKEFELELAEQCLSASKVKERISLYFSQNHLRTHSLNARPSIYYYIRKKKKCNGFGIYVIKMQYLTDKKIRTPGKPECGRKIGY